METTELEFGFSYTKQLPGEFGPFVKVSHRRVVTLTPSERNAYEHTREQLSDDVINFFINKVLEVEKA